MFFKRNSNPFRLRPRKKRIFYRFITFIFNTPLFTSFYFLQKEHDDQLYSLNKMNELLKKMLVNEKSGENEGSNIEIDAAFWKTEFECPICFEEMKPPMRIWQCVDGHPVCEGNGGIIFIIS